MNNFTTYKKLGKIIFLLGKLLFFYLKKDLFKEKQNLRFWYIIVFAIGILFCFYCAEKYRLLYMIAVLFIILLLSLCKIIFEKKHKILIKFLLFFLFGFIVAFFKVTGIKEGVFKSPNYDITIEGKIENIRLTSHENILILKATKAPNTDLYKGKIRIKYDPALFQNKNLSIGDIICIKTSLIPIRYSDFPNDSSYRNYAKFFDIIATGHAKEISLVEAQNKEIKQGLFLRLNAESYRNAIQKRIYEINKHSSGAGIVIAILTGNNSFIPNEQLNNIRHSGCAHILAISGLHMSIVVAFVFCLFIHFFALFPRIALRYNTKKLAVLPAILTCLFYLKISNIPISATRSFIMVAIGSMTMILNRSKASLNTLFITFFIMLCFSSNYILSPSFQLSFMAVFGLTTLYNNNFITESSIFSQKKTMYGYTVGILLSSIIATVSTVFFEIYHFKQYAWIGLISNIPVIPITEFLVLPFGFIGMLFNETYIGDICYMIAGFFANIVCFITDWTANLPNSFLLTKQMSSCQLCVIIFGIIMLFLSHAKTLKFIGFSLLLFGVFAYIKEPKFVLVYNQNLKNIVFFEKNKFYSVHKIDNKYINGIISQNLGTNEIIPMDKNNKNMKCTGNRKQRNMSCVYSIDNVLVQIKQGNSTRMVGVKIKNGKPVFIGNKYK